MKKLILIFAVLFFAAPGFAVEVELTAQWTQSTSQDVAEYRLYMAESSGGPLTMIAVFVGQVSTGAFNWDMEYGETLYFKLTAFDTEGLESLPSNEAIFRLPFPGEDRLPPQPPGGLTMTGRVLSQ